MNEPDELVEKAIFERELEAALARVAPPEGFGERVFARAYPASASPVRDSGRMLAPARSRLWLALAASLLLAALGFLGQRHHKQARRREARVKFDLSMSITRQTLAGVGIETRKQLSAAGIQLEP